MEKNFNGLTQFYGTQNYYKGFMDVTYTDGVMECFQNIAGWLISDMSVILKMEKKVIAEPFVSIKVTIKDSKARVEYTDGNDKSLYLQEYDYTDLEDGGLQLFYTNKVLMLSNEY